MVRMKKWLNMLEALNMTDTMSTMDTTDTLDTMDTQMVRTVGMHPLSDMIQALDEEVAALL